MNKKIVIPNMGYSVTKVGKHLRKTPIIKKFAETGTMLHCRQG